MFIFLFDMAVIIRRSRLRTKVRILEDAKNPLRKVDILDFLRKERM